MKVPSEDLFQLIKSLDRHEKRFFKMYASRRKEESQHARLFEAIDKQAQYDEKKLIHDLGEPDLEKTIKYAKRDLFKVILTTLEYYHEEDSVKNRLAKKLHQIRILMDKNLHGPASRILSEAKEVAVENELYPHIFEILSLESHLTRKKEELTEWSDLIRKGTDPHFELIDMYKEYLRYEFFELEVTHHLSTGEYQAQKKVHERLQKLLDEVMKNAPKYTQLKTTLEFNRLCFLLNAMLRNWEVAFDFQKKFIELFEQQSDLIEQGASYLTHLYNFALTCVFFKDVEEANIVWKKANTFVEALPTKLNSRSVLERLLSIEIAMVAALSTSCRYEESIERSLKVANDPHFEYLGTPLKKSLLFTISASSFYSGKYKDALTWVNKLVHAPEFNAEIRRDIDLSAVILNLLIHYELGNYELAASLVKSGVRSNSQDTDGNKLYKAFLRFMNDKLLKSAPAIPESADLQKFEDEIRELKESDFKARYILEDLDLIAWLRSKAQKRTMLEVLLEEYEQQKTKQVV